MIKVKKTYIYEGNGMYIEFLKKSFQQQFAYRTNTIIHLFTSFIYIFVTVNIWSALYNGKDAIDGVTIKEMLTYVLMVQLVRTIVRLSVSKYVAERVSRGIISIDFIRPVNLKFCAVFDSLGTALYNVMMFAAPMLVFGSVIWGFVLPSALYQWLLFIPALGLAIVLYATMEYIMGLTAFWTKTDFHISWVIGSFMTLFSGSLIPLWFYPEWLKSIAYFLPFQYFIFAPINIFLGKVDLNGALTIVLFQVIWLIIFILIERFIWVFAQRVITVQGG